MFAHLAEEGAGTGALTDLLIVFQQSGQDHRQVFGVVPRGPFQRADRALRIAGLGLDAPFRDAGARLQAEGANFDIYVVGSRGDDARIREWARRTRIDPAKVRNGHITLNHDAGRWLSLGVQGDLPAVVRQVGGQWQRQR